MVVTRYTAFELDTGASCCLYLPDILTPSVCNRLIEGIESELCR